MFYCTQYTFGPSFEIYIPMKPNSKTFKAFVEQELTMIILYIWFNEGATNLCRSEAKKFLFFCKKFIIHFNSKNMCRPKLSWLMLQLNIKQSMYLLYKDHSWLKQQWTITWKWLPIIHVCLVEIYPIFFQNHGKMNEIISSENLNRGVETCIGFFLHKR